MCFPEKWFWGQTIIHKSQEESTDRRVHPQQKEDHLGDIHPCCYKLHELDSHVASDHQTNWSPSLLSRSYLTGLKCQDPDEEHKHQQPEILDFKLFGYCIQRILTSENKLGEIIEFVNVASEQNRIFFVDNIQLTLL